MNGMKMTLKGLPLMAAAGAVLFSMGASTTVDAAEITVFHGSEISVVDTNAPHKGPHVLRGGIREPLQTARVAGIGDTVWFRTDHGLMACSLRPTGQAGGKKRIDCVGR